MDGARTAVLAVVAAFLIALCARPGALSGAGGCAACEGLRAGGAAPTAPQNRARAGGRASKHARPEYSSPGDGGYGVGPMPLGINAGIPKKYIISTEPIRWRVDAGDDYFGPEGPTVHNTELRAKSLPDHDVLER